MAEVALSEGEDLGGLHGEDQHEIARVRAGRSTCGGRVGEAIVGDLELPLPVPLAGPGGGKSFEGGFVGDPPGLSFDRHVKSLVPLVAAGGQTTLGLLARFRAFCSVGPVLKWRVSLSHTATSGVTWGRPSVRTVMIQNSCAFSSASRVIAHVARVPGSLKRSSSSITGSSMIAPILEGSNYFALK